MSRCGFISVVGPTNAGKSTFINQAVGTKVSIVSPKVQTTRARVLGIHSAKDTQMIFIDTPGFFNADKSKGHKLDQAMHETAWQSTQDGDIVLFMVDASREIGNNMKAMLEKLKTRNHPPKILALNKIDSIDRTALLARSQEYNDLCDFEKTFMISALKNQGINDCIRDLTTMLPESPFYYDAEQVSDMPLRQLCAEITREKLFNNLHEELPYAVSVECEEWVREEGQKLRIRQVIYVERASQKAIILGKGGASIKRIGIQSRHEIENIAEEKVNLKLFVKVQKNWQDDPERLSSWNFS